MNYLHVKNWEKLQHQSNKPLPWIKFFTALLAPTKDPDLSELADNTRLLLYHIWLMARVFDGHIPETWLNREKLNVKSRINLSPLIDLGYVWFQDEAGNKITQSLSPSRTRDARLNSKSLTSVVSRESKALKSKALIEEFILTTDHREWAIVNAPSVPIEIEFSAWKDRLRTNGYTSGKAPGIPIVSPQSSFYTAMRNAENWGTYRNGNGGKRGGGGFGAVVPPPPEPASDRIATDETNRALADQIRAAKDKGLPIKAHDERVLRDLELAGY